MKISISINFYIQADAIITATKKGCNIPDIIPVLELDICTESKLLAKCISREN